MLKVFLLCLLVIPSVAFADFSPKKRVIALTEFTTLNVDIVPDLGTRFVFPFVLDESSENIPFTLKLTNPVFQSKREPGRNFFIVEIPPQEAGGAMPAYLGNLFINVAGYNISVLLKSTPKLKDHYTDIVFKLTDEKREQLIEDAVKARVDVMKAMYKEKEDLLDRQAYKMAMDNIGAMLVKGGSSNNISEDEEFVLNNGDVLILSLNKLFKYNRFSIFTYEMAFESGANTSIAIQDIKLFGKTDDDKTELIQSQFDMASAVTTGKNALGNLTTDQNIDDYVGFQVDVMTSKGNLKLLW